MQRTRANQSYCQWKVGRRECRTVLKKVISPFDMCGDEFPLTAKTVRILTEIKGYRPKRN